MDEDSGNEVINEIKICNNVNSIDVNQALSASAYLVGEILNVTSQSIKQAQLLKHQSQFSHLNIMGFLQTQLYQFSPNFGALHPSKLQEQDVTKIIKIDKDNLSPKQLPSQHPQQDETVKQLPDVLSQLGSKRLSMTNRSSFLKRKSSQISQLPSGSVTQRGNIQNNLSVRSKNSNNETKLQKFNSKKQDPLKNFTLVVSPQNDDPEILHLRQKVEFNRKEKEKQQKILSDRMKQDQQKLDSFNTSFGENRGYTFDFDGETIGSQALKDEKINYYAMRVGIKTLNKKYRAIYKNLEQSKDQQNKSIAIQTKLGRRRQSAFDTINNLNSSQQIPLFQREHKSFVPETDPAKLKILEYKRLYGKKFSRYDKNSMTIDLESILDKKIVEEDFFTAKRHLTDSLSINKSRSSSVSKQYVPKKLALPKLQGKYKVLDRYEQL